MDPQATRHPGMTTRAIALLFAVAAGAGGLAGCNAGGAEARELSGACEGGDATACRELGDRLRLGQHVLADWRRAAELYDRACEAGEGDACVRVARLRLRESAGRRGVALDSAGAVALLERGCASGAPIGCTDLGDLIRVTDSLAAADSARAAPGEGGGYGDLADAAELYGRACDAGEMTACTRLGLLHAAGSGVQMDSARAVRLHTRSCDGGSQLGCVHLGRAYETGLGVESDPTRAAELYEQACESEDQRELAGCFRLAELLRSGTGVSRDVDRAVDLFFTACYPRSTRERTMSPIPASCFRLGDMYATGDGVERNPFRATSYLRRACSLGYDAACEDS